MRMRIYTRIIMKRTSTIGFDARHAIEGDTSLSSYSRYIIDAISLACPRRAYFRLYADRESTNIDYRTLTTRHNVEAMLPDGRMWRKMPWLWRQYPIGNDLLRGDVELYHSLDDTLPYGLSRRNIRTIVTIHTLDYLSTRIFQNPIESGYRRIMTHSSLSRADRIIALSEGLKRDIVEKFGIDSDKIDVIYRGCDARYGEEPTTEVVEQTREKYNLPERYVLTCGTQLQRKNTAIILDALTFTSDDLHLVVASRHTPYIDRLQQHANELGIAHRLHVIEPTTLDERVALYHLAEAYLLMSLYEGFATSIVEALMSGTPVVAARGTTHEEAGGPHSIYIDSDDANALAEAIEQLSSDNTLREETIAHGRSYATRFRPEVTAYNILNCYRRINIDIDE